MNQQLQKCTEPRISNAFNALREKYATQLKQTDDLIDQHMQSPVHLIPELSKHLVNAGGKRIRPLMTIAAADLCNGDMNRAVVLGASIEFIHSATLLHDDVIDNSSTRRSRPTANAVWGNHASVLVGDFLFGRSFDLMIDDGDLTVLKILSSVSSRIIEGEVMQLLSCHDFQRAQSCYMDIVIAKTGALFSAATEVGAALSHAPQDQREAMAEYGMNIGIAFQFVDDILDYFMSEDSIGKSPGDDFYEGKVTLPVLQAYKHGNKDQKEILEACFKDGQQTKAVFETVKKILIDTDAEEASILQAQTYAQKAKKAISAFPGGNLKIMMEDLADFCVQRVY